MDSQSRRFKTSSYSSGNSPIFDFKVVGGNFIAGENKSAHRANFVTKIKFNAMTYTKNSTVVAELVKVKNDCARLKDDFDNIIRNVRNKEDVEIVRKHILLMFDELLINEVKEKIDAMKR